MQTLKIISSMASHALLLELALRFETLRGQPVEVEAAGGVEVARRVRAGEPVDVVVLARDTIDALAGEGALRADTVTDVVQCGIAVAVPAGTPAPDLSSEATVRAAVSAASSIGYSTGPSGVYLEKKFESWGLLDALKSRITVAPPGIPVGRLVAEGRVALGFQQMSELIGVAGIDLAGSLPSGMQLITTFSAAIATRSSAVSAAGVLLEYLQSPQTSDIKQRFGMQPAG